MNGNNVVSANKNLKAETLKQFGMDSAEAIITQVTNGKNAMPAFKGRLNEEQIKAVAAYVLDKSAKGW
jgi:cytochrome c6